MIFAKKRHFLALGASLKPYKRTKNQNIKNLTDQKFLNIIRNIYTKNWTNRTNIEEEDTTLLRSWGTHFFLSRKIGPKTGPFRAEKYPLFDH